MILGIYGSGGCGQEVKDIADILKVWDEIIYIDDTVERDLFKGIKRMPFDAFDQIYAKENAEIIIALGEPEYRIMLYKKVKEKGYTFANVIHPSAFISPSAKMGRGLIIKPWVVVSCDAVIGDNVRIESFSGIGHGCIVRESSQLSAGVIMGGESEIGEGTYIGMNVPILEKIKVGSNSVVGAGSTVQREIPDNVIALGNPAKAMKYKNENKIFK